MRAPRLLASLLLASSGCAVQTVAQEEAPASTSVDYVATRVSQKSGQEIQLLSGSRWRLGRTTYVLLAFKDVVIILGEGGRHGVLFVEGDTAIPVTHLSGKFTPESGTITEVVRAPKDGAVLQTADGRLWDIPEYDQYDTGWWLPPYPVLVTASELYMYNLEEVGRIWVNPR